MELNQTFQKEANILPEKQRKYMYTYLLLRKDPTTGITALIKECAVRSEVTQYLSKNIEDMEKGLFSVYRTTGQMPLRVKKEVHFEL